MAGGAHVGEGGMGILSLVGSGGGGGGEGVVCCGRVGARSEGGRGKVFFVPV